MNSNCAIWGCTITNRNTTMDTKTLRQKILDLAIRGKLVPQDPNDEPASVLLERIKAEKERLIKEGKIKRSKKSAKTSDTPHYENVPFEVPDNWVWTTIDELCDVVRGGSPRPAGDEKYYNGAIPFLKVADLTKDAGIYVYKAEYTIKEAGLKKTRLVNDGTLLLTNSGATLGVPKITTFSTTFNDGIAAFLYLNEEIQLYLYWLLKSKTDSFRKIDQGAAQPNLNTDLIKSILIPLPPLAEQHRIVTEIERWFSLIDIIETGKDDLQTIIKQAKNKILDLAIHGKLVLQDPNDEPAIELLKRINPDFTPCDNGHSEKLPQSWCLSRLKELCSFLSRGKSPKYSDNDKTIPVFAQKCNLKEGGISLEQARFLDPSTICKWSEVYKLQTGDILINSTGTGTVGRTRLFNESYLGQYPFVLPDSHISVVRAKAGIIPQYLYAYISSNKIQQYIEDNLAGSTNQKELYIGVLEQMEIFVPPSAEQQRIVQKIKELFSVLDNIQNALEV